jgi:hypothetical protein
VYGVKAFGLSLGQVHHFGSNNLETGVFKTGIDFTNNVLGNCVGFDDGKGTFNSHFGLQKLGLSE